MEGHTINSTSNDNNDYSQSTHIHLHFHNTEPSTVNKIMGHINGIFGAGKSKISFDERLFTENLSRIGNERGKNG